MNNAKVIGVGAAGNKAVIKLIEDGVMRKEQVMLLNSTLKDVPAEYKDLAIEFSGSSKGCGKERDLAKRITLDSLQQGKVPLDSFLDPDDKMVIIANSSEGGTGCGSSTILAKYFKEVLKANVHTFVFTGFEEDGRGLKNTVDYFQDLSETYTVQAISNRKFLKECNGNKIKAEAAANAEFSTRVRILLGQDIIESDSNIDETDLTKVTITPGFMTIEHGVLEKCKNVEAFNKMVSDIIDNSKSLDFEPTAKRLAVILNISDKTKDNVDYLFNTIKEKLGTPFETFTHIQSEQEPEYIAIIASGMKMPIDDVKAVYDRYVEATEKVDTSKDNFFSMKVDTKGSSMFDMTNNVQDKTQKIEAKNNFFSGLSVAQDSIQTEKGTFSNIKKNTDNL